jgi:MoxR-like ATPase
MKTYIWIDYVDERKWRGEILDYLGMAQSAVEIMAPALPFLIMGGKKAVEEAGRKIGSDAYDKAKSIWDKVNSNKKIQEAAKDVSVSPENEANRLKLAKQLEDLFIEREDIAEQVNGVLKIQVAQKIEDLSGEATAAEVGEMTKGEVEISQEIQTVSSDGGATAFQAEKVTGGRVEVHQKIDKLEHGAKAIGTKIDKI